jgi:LmbE family N-acetylglucosaminyl deacetylase
MAHEDDDLLFMNPDIQQSIRSTHTVTAIYLTAGDAGGTQDYWEGREAGIRAAYAAMAKARDSWTFTTETINGKPVYHFSLGAFPNISLYFLRLPDGAPDGSGFEGPSDCRPTFTSLLKLWNGEVTKVPVLGTWSCSAAGAAYTKTELITTLQQLFQLTTPTRVHSQDPSGLHGDDHSDHVQGAKFVFNAHLLYAGPHQLVVHRDYNISLEPENLTTQQKTDKTNIFCTYAAHDSSIDNCKTTGIDPDRVGSWLGSEYESAALTRADGWLAGLTDKCLTVSDHITVNGNPLQLSDCSGTTTQNWSLTGNKIQLAGTQKCVALAGSDTTNGNGVYLSDCGDVAWQRWTLTSDGALRGLDGKCLEATSSENGAPIQIEDCTSRSDTDLPEFIPEQNWTLRFGVVSSWTSDGRFNDSDASGRYVTTSSFYGSVRLGDVNGDHLADICGREPDGVYCAVNNGQGGFRPSTRFTVEFSDANGWKPERYGITLMMGDVNGDGRDDMCGRSPAGITCATASPDGMSFIGSRVWTTAFSDATEFDSGISYYGSLRLVDVNGDGYADVCGRGAKGIQCALNNRSGGFGAATSWLNTEFLDSRGWKGERYGMTIDFGDINGDGHVDVCGRGPDEIICATGKASGTGFESPRRWSLQDDFADGSPLTDWSASRAYYGSLRLVDINGDGYADICGRSSQGIVCGMSTGNMFGAVRRVVPQDYTDDNGWGVDAYGMTLRFASLDGHGGLDVCGRRGQTILCSKAP